MVGSAEFKGETDRPLLFWALDHTFFLYNCQNNGKLRKNIVF